MTAYHSGTMTTPIASKAEMYRRLNAGLLGHTLPAAETLADAERMVRHGGRFAVRTKHAGGLCRFDMGGPEAVRLAASLPPGTWNLSPMLSDPHRVCYGHLLDGPGGWSLHYSDEKRPCRLLASKDGCEQKHLQGLAARLYLRGVMDDIGWETLLALVESYPDHVVEFTVMSGSAHAFGPSNVIFWEVRSTDGWYEADLWGPPAA